MSQPDSCGVLLSGLVRRPLQRTHSAQMLGPAPHTRVYQATPSISRPNTSGPAPRSILKRPRQPESLSNSGTQPRSSGPTFPFTFTFSVHSACSASSSQVQRSVAFARLPSKHTCVDSVPWNARHVQNRVRSLIAKAQKERPLRREFCFMGLKMASDMKRAGEPGYVPRPHPPEEQGPGKEWKPKEWKPTDGHILDVYGNGLSREGQAEYVRRVRACQARWNIPESCAYYLVLRRMRKEELTAKMRRWAELFGFDPAKVVFEPRKKWKMSPLEAWEETRDIRDTKRRRIYY